MVGRRRTWRGTRPIIQLLPCLVVWVKEPSPLPSLCSSRPYAFSTMAAGLIHPTVALEVPAWVCNLVVYRREQSSYYA